MVKISSSGLLLPGYLFLAILSIDSTSSTANNTTSNEKNPFKRQTDTFLVGANIGVQSEHYRYPEDKNHYDQDKIHREIENNQIYLDVPHSNGTIDLQIVHEEHNGFLQYNPEPLPTADAWRASKNDFRSKYDADFDRRYRSSTENVITHQHEARTFKHFDGHSIHHQPGLGRFQSSKSSDDIVYGASLPTTTSPIRDTTRPSYQQNLYSTIQPFIPTYTHPLLTSQGHTTAVPLTQTSHQPSNPRIDQKVFEGNELHDTHEPSVRELQNIISKIVKGATKVHQVVKVPAVYEIHLQQEEIPVKQTTDYHNFNIPLPHRVQMPEYSYLPNSFYEHKQSPQWGKAPFNNKYTKTWNLPSKIRYFDKTPSNIDSYFASTSSGKYFQPKPFTFNLPRYSHRDGSVNNVITPKSTAVGSLEYIQKPSLSSLDIGTPDLSLYYAKKKELYNSGLHGWKDSGLRRNERIGAANSVNSGRKGYQRFFLPSITRGLNYVIHVREKPTK